MRARTLDPREWATKLAATEFAEVWPYMPADTTFIVVEDDTEAVVGAWALVLYAHVEGIWVDPGHRGKGAVFGQLLEAMFAEARRRTIPTVLTGAMGPDVERMILRLGGSELPGKHFVLPVPAAKE